MFNFQGFGWPPEWTIPIGMEPRLVCSSMDYVIHFSVLRLARDQRGPMFLQLPLDISDHIWMLFAHVHSFARVLPNVEQKWWIVFLERHRRSRRRVTGRGQEMRLKRPLANSK